MIFFAAFPAGVGLLFAGPLASKVFQPMLDDSSALAGSIGALIGTGAGGIRPEGIGGD